MTPKHPNLELENTTITRCDRLVVFVNVIMGAVGEGTGVGGGGGRSRVSNIFTRQHNNNRPHFDPRMYIVVWMASLDSFRVLSCTKEVRTTCKSHLPSYFVREKLKSAPFCEIIRPVGCMVGARPTFT